MAFGQRADGEQQIKPEEQKNLANILSGSEDAKNKAFAEGVHVTGERYVAFQVEDRHAYLRQVRG